MNRKTERVLIALCLCMATFAIWLHVGSSAADADRRADRIKAEILKACPRPAGPVIGYRGAA